MSAARSEICGVSVVGFPELVETGPTPVGAPFLANELAQRLLPRVPPTLQDPAVRFVFDVPVLLTFSFELDAAVLAQLAERGAGCEVCINDATPNMASFHAWKASGALESYPPAEFDPDRISAALGLEPTTLRRAGERMNPRSTQVLTAGVWRCEREVEPPIDLDRLIRVQCEAFGDDVPTRCADVRLAMRLSLQVKRLQGGFRLRRGVVARLAALRVPLGCFFYNMGA